MLTEIPNVQSCAKSFKDLSYYSATRFIKEIISHHSFIPVLKTFFLTDFYKGGGSELSHMNLIQF